MSSFEPNLTPEGHDEAIIEMLDTEESLEDIWSSSSAVWNSVDVAILRAMGRDLKEVVIKPFVDEATAAAYPELAKLINRPRTIERWPLEGHGAEEMLLNQAISKEPGLEARDPYIQNVYLDVENIAITLEEPLLEDFPETSVVTELSTVRSLSSSEVSVYFKTEGGFRIAYLFEDATGLPRTTLGGMKGAYCEEQHLECERQITPPGSPDESAIYNKLAEGEEVSPDEDRIILNSFKAYSEASRQGLLVPHSEEVLRVARAIYLISLDGKFAGKTKLTLTLCLYDGQKSWRHDVEL